MTGPFGDNLDVAHTRPIAPAPVPAARRPGRRLDRFQHTAAGGRLLPLSGLSGPMPLVIAIMVAMTIIAAAAGLALRNVAAASSNQLAGGVTVQIVEARPAARAQQANASVAVLRATTGVNTVRLVPQSEINVLIEPWLGADGNTDPSGGHDDRNSDDSTAVPVPALIDVQLNGTITPQRLSQLAQQVHRVAPTARIDAQANWLQPVFEAIESLQWLAVALIALLAGAMAAAVLLAARTALDNHRSTIEIVHMLGGSDPQVARIVQRAIGVDTAVGGAIGLVLALVVILFLGARFASLDAGIVAGGALGFNDWLVLLAIPVVAVVLAMLTARLSVLNSLRQML